MALQPPLLLQLHVLVLVLVLLVLLQVSVLLLVLLHLELLPAVPWFEMIPHAVLPLLLPLPELMVQLQMSLPCLPAPCWLLLAWHWPLLDAPWRLSLACQLLLPPLLLAWLVHLELS